MMMMIVDEVEVMWNWSWPILRYCVYYFLGGSEENHSG